MEPQRILTKVYASQPQWLDPERVENKWLKTGDPGDMASDTKEIELPGPNGTTEKYLYSEMSGEWVKKARNLDRVVKYPATVEVVDYDKEILRVSGAVINRFMKYRAILWAHNHSQPVNGNVPVIGNAIRMKKDVTSKPYKLYIWPEFIPPETNSFADNVFGHIKGGWMPSGSLGFWPTEANYGDVEKQGWRREIVKWFFIEFSPCPVGCNYEVLAELEKAYADQYGHEKSLWPGTDFDLINREDMGGLAKTLSVCIDNGDGFCRTHPELEVWIKGRVLDKPAGDWKWYLWTQSEAAKWVKDGDYKPIGTRKDPNFWHFSLTKKEKYSEFRNQWVGGKVKPAKFDPKNPEGRPVKLNLGHIKDSKDWETHNLEFYHGEKDLAEKILRERVHAGMIKTTEDCAREIGKILVKIEAFEKVLEQDIIPRLAVSKSSRPDEDPAGKAAGSKASEKDDEAGVSKRLKQAGDRLIRVDFEPDKKEGGYGLGRLLRDCVGDLPEGTPEGGEKDDV